MVALELQDARAESIQSNLGLVHACAQRFKGRGVEYDDLYAAGCLGLVKATDGFDTTRGVRFSTYAVPVILGEMRRLFREGGTVKVSRSIKELAMRVNRERERLSYDLGKEPTVSQLAAALDCSEEAVAEAICATTPPLSLTADRDEGGGQFDVPVPSPEELLSEGIALRQAIAMLPPVDRKLMVLRYFCRKTQVQTAKALSMTQVQVSRREKKILQLLRTQLE